MKALSNFQVSQDLEYHLNRGLGISECVFMYGSEKYCDLLNEVRILYKEGKLLLEGRDKTIAELKSGETAIYKGKKVKLHLPEYDNTGNKKFIVYLESGEIDKETELPIAKILRFGDPNSTIKNYDKEKADNFQARHDCENKTDIDSAGFWSCNIHLFAKHIGLKSGYPW